MRYETGQLDIVQIYRGDVERFRDSNDPLDGPLPVRSRSLLCSIVGFNAGVPPFDDVHVRRAFAKAIDVGKITRVSLRGHQKQANGDPAGRIPGARSFANCARLRPRRRARGACKIGVWVRRRPAGDHNAGCWGRITTAGVTLEASLYLIRENLGVDVAVQTLEWSSFLDQVYGDMSEFQMYSLGWGADYPDPHNFLDLMFHSRSVENVSHYSNPEVDGLLETARAEVDRDRRLRLYASVESIVVDEARDSPVLVFSRSPPGQAERSRTA